jgi:hypothetical protein
MLKQELNGSTVASHLVIQILLPSQVSLHSLGDRFQLLVNKAVREAAVGAGGRQRGKAMRRKLIGGVLRG